MTQPSSAQTTPSANTPRFRTLDTLNASGKTVLVRVDFNVPVQDGQITDTSRIDRVKPTIDRLRAQGAKVVMMAHFGRPKAAPEPQFSLDFLAQALPKLWGYPVTFAADCVGAQAEKAVAALHAGDVLLLENVRFHAGEEKNEAGFAKSLAALGDVFVNDAFSAAHRAHASTAGIADHLPAYAGLLMEAELKALEAALTAPVRPVAAIVGGAKISTKLELLGNLVGKVDVLILGGGMANTFLAAKGVDVKKSLCEHDMKDEARAIMDTAERGGCRIILPVDFTCAAEFKANADHVHVAADAIPDGFMALDIGPRSADHIIAVLKDCKTVVWNGPLGAFEIKPFDAYTNAVASAVAERTAQGKILSVAGGGDTVSALANAGVDADGFSYLSGAGGAFLEWLEGKTLPGVAALYPRV